MLDSRPVAATATIALLVLIALSGYFAVSRDHAVTTTSDVDYRVIYTTEQSNRLFEIDPLTLADVPNGQTISVVPSPVADEARSAPDVSDWRASDDGTTLIGVESSRPIDPPHQQRLSVVVVDARTGVVQRRFPIDEEFYSGLIVSASGNHIAIQYGPVIVTDPPQSGVIDNTPSRWDFYDTTTGQRLTTIQSSLDRDPLQTGLGWLDPSGERFYRLAIDRDALYPGPWPVQLVSHDVTTGLETARVDLPNVRAGFWPSEELVDPSACLATPGPPPSRENWIAEGPLWQVYSPGIALSPDGTTMVFVNPDSRAMTTVNLTTMSIQRTMTITDSAQRSSPTAVQEVNEPSCRVRAAQQRFVTFSRDGTDLYLSGYDVFIIGESTMDIEIVPLIRVNVANGNVEARRTGGNDRLQLQYPGGTLSPDGRNLYLLVAGEDDTDVILQRLDADSLDVLAQRTFDSFGGVAIVVSRE